MKKSYTIRMKRSLFTTAIALVVALCSVSEGIAQDIHYTNFGYSPLNINPALTGVFTGDGRFTGNYRSQWSNVPVGYNTFSGSYDTKFGSALRHSPFRLGTFFSYDQAGDSKLNNLALYVTGAYVLPFMKTNFLSLGASVGGHQRRFLTQDLRYGEQFRSKTFNSTNPITDPTQTVFDQSINYADVSVGANVRHEKGRRQLDFGVGVFHLNQPVKSHNNIVAVKLEPRVSAYIAGSVPIGRHFDFMGDMMAQYQGPHEEWVVGAGLRMYLVQKATKLFAIEGGATLRNGDAWVPRIGVVYNQWRVGLNYDINFSNFRPASIYNGGPELNVIYIFSKVPPAHFCPLCPVYL